MATQKGKAGKSGPVEHGGASAKKRKAILDAAGEVFLRDGYVVTNMDEIAERAGVAKQTVYNHFSDKESLFVEVVTSMTSAGSDAVRNEVQGLEHRGDVAAYLRDYAQHQLKIVLTPRLMQLRRVVIGEVARFPDLGKALYEAGPKRAIAALAAVLAGLAARNLLAIDDPREAATWFNWLVMSEPVNRAMLLGDSAIPSASAQRRHAEAAVRVFLAAYGVK